MSTATDFETGAVDIINEFPRTLTFTRVTAGTYDPATGVAAAPTTKNYTVTGALVRYNDRYINGTTILAMDRKVYIAGKGLQFEPQIGDTMTAGSDVYRVVERYLREISAVNVLWELQVRR